MKSLAFVIASLLMPLTVFAAGINSSTSAEADSGGNAAQGGTTMTGDSSASASMHTLINSNTGVSNVKVEVETGSNGIVNTGLLEKTISPKGSTEIHIATSSKNTIIDIEVEKHISRFSGILEVASSTTHASALFVWFDWMLPLHLSERVISLPQESSTTVSLEEDQGTFGLSAFFRRLADRLLTFW